MNSINLLNSSENFTKVHRWKKLPYAILLTTLLNISSPSEAKVTYKYNLYKETIELQQDTNIVNNIETITGVSLPKGYDEKIRNFVNNSQVIKGIGAEFTEDFIINQMKLNWGISKENQLLFIWDAIYEQITNKNFYDGTDGDDNRLSEFEKVIDNMEVCGREYKEQFVSYMNKRSEEANKRSDKANAEAIESINNALSAIIDFYNYYQISPDQKRLDSFMHNVEEIISLCKKYGIDYKALLPEEVRKFYGIE